MPENIALFVVLVIALGIGFLFGRRARKQRESMRSAMRASEYFQGLNYLLNERPDLAIDTFIDSLDVDNDTVDTHLALGSLVRRRGEVDKAIRIHQNVLARPVLSKQNRAQTELELARDYLQAGLLDRAENLLVELSSQPEMRIVALEHLLEIYQRERDWERAEETGRKLLGRNDGAVRRALAHFLCERTEGALQEGNLKQARQLAERARDYDGRCFRVELVLARVDYEAKRYRDCLRQLRRARDLRPELAGQTLGLYRDACNALGADDDYTAYVEDTVRQTPTLELVEEVAAIRRRVNGPDSARAFLGEQLLRRPSFVGLSRLIAEYEDSDDGVPLDHMRLIRTFAETLASRRPLYRCGNCGFTGRSLLWQCPSCRLWDRFDPVHDFENDSG